MINTEASSRSARLDPMIPTRLVPEICCGVLRWWDSQWLQHCPSGHIQTHHLVKWSRMNKATYLVPGIKNEQGILPGKKSTPTQHSLPSDEPGRSPTKIMGSIANRGWSFHPTSPASKGVAVPCHCGHFASRGFVLRLGQRSWVSYVKQAKSTLKAAWKLFKSNYLESTLPQLGSK